MNPTETVKESLAEGLEQLVELSLLYGGDDEFCIAGGGNTSVKDERRLLVKASGISLGEIDAGGFVEMDRAALHKLLERDLGDDADRREALFKEAIYAARLHPEKGQRPSVECALHNTLPTRFVIHTHCTMANRLTCARGGEAVARELFGDEILWMPYVDPGFVLARTLVERLGEWRKRTGSDCPPAVLMDNHGLIICGETAEEIHERTEWLVSKVRARIEQAGPAREPYGPKAAPFEAADSRRLINVIGPALRAFLGNQQALRIVRFSDDEVVRGLLCGEAGRAAATTGPMTPDQIVYCRSYPLWFEPRADEDEGALIDRLREAVAAHVKKTGFAPNVVLVPRLGLFAAGSDAKAAEIVRLVYTDAIKIMAGARRLDGVDYLTDRQRKFIEDWEVEAYRAQVTAGAARRGRVAGKVAVVTGAAQGFGLEISRGLAAEGAHVALTDLNEAGARAAAHSITKEQGSGRALGLTTNVADVDSVSNALHQIVRAWGGFDLFISNAGVLKAESVLTQPVKDFKFVTDVNYVGYFVCVQQAAPIMARQRRARPEVWGDIIQINSKSGLQGSNRNAAYAGAKFGGIGLTQSFAMELVELGIKVNAICPGNFFDGPLWSDPENGLFAQYLRSGKVPGAKSVADVRRAYEDKVPMGRGCAAADVLRAVYYLVDQEYETGQALPVTGGQVMLR